MTIVYSLPNCVQCRTTKMILTRMDVPFQEVMLHNDEDAAAYVKSLGYQQAPVVVTDSGEHWSGLDPARLATLA